MYPVINEFAGGVTAVQDTEQESLEVSVNESVGALGV